MSEFTETTHRLVHGDARELSFLEDESVHLVLTSPPYWTLKEYRPGPAQMGHIEEYDEFLDQLHGFGPSASVSSSLEADSSA